MKRKYYKKKIAELSSIIESQKRLLAINTAETEELHDKHEKLMKRFQTAGSEIKTIDNGAGPIQVIHVKTQTWGKYIVAPSFSETDLPAIKESLVTDIVKALLKENIVQFIHHQADTEPSIYDVETFAAKLFVVPWEQLRTEPIKLERPTDNETGKAHMVP